MQVTLSVQVSRVASSKMLALPRKPQQVLLREFFCVVPSEPIAKRCTEQMMAVNSFK